jgi:enamine deaminase RidA (YjgF/YER057c/UK114 family)
MPSSTSTDTAEQRLSALGLTLPAIKPPGGSFVHATLAGEWLYLSGHPPFTLDGGIVLGRLGETLTLEQGIEAARLSALGMLATMRAELGSLDRVRRIMRVYGVVNATPDFIHHTQVINGASNLLVEVFGDAGRHARMAVGVSSLPFNMALECDLVAHVKP